MSLEWKLIILFCFRSPHSQLMINGHATDMRKTLSIYCHYFWKLASGTFPKIYREKNAISLKINSSYITKGCKDKTNGLKAIKGHGFVDAKRRTRKADYFQINWYATMHLHTMHTSFVNDCARNTVIILCVLRHWPAFYPKYQPPARVPCFCETKYQL